MLLLVWFFTFDLSGKGDPTNSYAPAGIALRILRTHKPFYPIDIFGKVEVLRLVILLMLIIT